MHTLYLPNLSDPGHPLIIEGEEARHAVRVKRLQVGALLRVLDGRGTVVLARVTDTRGRLVLSVEERRTVPALVPALRLCTATPKGPRVDELVDALAQVGVASWAPMQTKLGVVDPRESKLARLERIAVEAAKQAQRPWLMTLEEKISFEEALRPAPGVAMVLADGSGKPYTPTGASTIRVLIGPEGGFVQAEVDAARTAGAQVISLTPHTLRIELAAPIAAAIILERERAG